MDSTSEFSFVLKPAEYGIGIFAVHDIKKGTYLRLFGDEVAKTDMYTMRNKVDIPEFFRQYCVDRGEKMISPNDFGKMELGWYTNHSKNPNAYHDNYDYYSLRDIKAGEEITIDYNNLGEPEESKENFYKS